MGKKLNVPLYTDFTQSQDGYISRILKSGIRYVRWITPSGEKRQILYEEDFVKYILDLKLSREELRKKYGVSLAVFAHSRIAYKKKYFSKLKEARSYQHSKAMFGNKRGKKDQPGVIVRKSELKKLITKGLSIERMARELNISEWYVHRNLKYHGLIKGGTYSDFLRNLDSGFIRHLEYFSPGIKESISTYYKNPHKYFLKLYEVFAQVNELLWFIQDMKGAHAYWREVGKIPKDHICWSMNKSELMLSQALISEKILHIRQFRFYGKYMADFYFPERKLLVEIDGNQHTMFESIKRRDVIRDQKAKESGYIMVHYTEKKVRKELRNVVLDIKSKLSSR
jgi:very-short-patch-repair endonuclease